VGTGVFDGVADGIRVGVLVGGRVGVDVIVPPGMRVLVGGLGVRELTMVGVPAMPVVGEKARVSVGTRVGVDTYCVMTSTVSAATVLMFEKAESTMF
jgi:hypothetical protein